MRSVGRHEISIRSISDEEISYSHMSSAVAARGLAFLRKANRRLVVLSALHRLDLDSLSFLKASRPQRLYQAIADTGQLSFRGVLCY